MIVLPPRVVRGLRDLCSARGTGLAEILASAAIVAIGLVALASAIPLAALAVREGDQISVAAFLASARLDQVRRARWSLRPAIDELGVSASATAAPRVGATATFPDEPSAPEPQTGYSRQVRVTDCSAHAGCAGAVSPDLRQITVTVQLPPGRGASGGATARTVVLTTLMARR